MKRKNKYLQHTLFKKNKALLVCGALFYMSKKNLFNQNCLKHFA